MAKKGTKLVEIVARVSTVGFMQTPTFVAKWAIGLYSTWVARKYSLRPKLLECFKKSQCPKLGGGFPN
jgi:hypothetical protein